MPHPNENQPTVFVVDDDKQSRNSLVALVEGFEFRVLAFRSPNCFLECYPLETSGCLVLDISTTRQYGLQLYEQLIREEKRLPVIFIAAHADVSTAVAAMKRGAVEFLEKPFDPKALLQSVRKAIKLDAHWRRQDAYFEAIANRIEQLSERERETLTLIQAGESNKAMAARLYLTERAVEMRRASIMKKLKVCTLAQLLDLTTTHRILAEQRQELDHRRSHSTSAFR